LENHANQEKVVADHIEQGDPLRHLKRERDSTADLYEVMRGFFCVFVTESEKEASLLTSMRDSNDVVGPRQAAAASLPSKYEMNRHRAISGVLVGLDCVIPGTRCRGSCNW